MKRTLRALAAASFLGAAMAVHLVASTVQNYGPFTVTFYDNGESDTVYTGGQNWTAQQMADIGTTIAAWDDGILNVQGTQLRLHAFWTEFGANNILGGASSAWYADGGGTAYFPAELNWRDGQAIDPGPTFVSDLYIRYDITAGGAPGGWNFGTGTPAADAADFQSVNTHELGHLLGYVSTYSSATDTFGLPTADAGGGLTAWDTFLRDSAGNAPAVNSSGTPLNFDETDNPAFFVGPNAQALYGGPVPIYAPATYAPGSSLTHWNEGSLPNALMSNSLAAGQIIRAPTDIDWAAMRDLGWTLVPEPVSVTLVLFAAAAVGRRRR